MKGFLNLKIKIPAAIIILTILLCPAAPADTKVSQVLEKVVENCKQFSGGMSVPYQREILTKSTAMLDDVGFDKASGIFFFKEPDMLKVQQEIPTTEYIISNGKNIWWYVPEKKTATKLDEIGKSLSILSMIFMGLKDPSETFSITLAEPEKTDEYRFLLIPDESWEEIDSIKVTVSAGTHMITRIEISDIAGNLTRFTLGEFKQKADMDDSFFDFKVPQDVKVIEEEQ